MHGSSPHVEQEKGCPYPALATPQLSKGDMCRFACKSLLTETGLCRHEFFSAVAQGTAKIRPRVIFNWKNFIEQLKLILKWMLIERWTRPSMLSSMCQDVARLQFVSCAEKDSLCGTVMIHDGLNWICLDQCHGVRSRGKSSSQGWHKRIVIQQSAFSL